ncbi:hypothetical protein SEA_MOLLYMUR_7 [Gordonia phage Mollymur]|uniref:Uncharacterized protein n=1 Tax=Gordonia phage Mollymur TaxID=2590895 RepID=A0A4Y6EKL1_9CAUD|nr:hypothetical protein PQB84_gp007 [Gordonia phage Mollymur]QDF15369.1 hypothetical protein SEA_MOLLYMUR_7 [Gordonia phage Mollymur]
MWVVWNEFDAAGELEHLTWKEAFAYMGWLSARNIPAYARKVSA